MDDQIGIFESTYELTALEYDYYLVDYYFDLNGPDAEGAVITTAVNTDAEEVADGVYLIPSGETKTFEYQHAVQVPDSGFYRIEPRWMLYLDETNEISDPIETGNLIALSTEFRTDYLFINENPSIPNSDENALDGFAVLRYAQLDQADETNLETGSGESALAVLTLGFEGGDVKITDFEAVFTTVPNVDLFEAFSSFSLWIDGDLIEVVSVTDENFDEQEDIIQFSGLDIVVMDDLNVQYDEIEIVIAGNINSDVAPSVIGDYELAVTGVGFVNGLQEEVYETSLGDIGIDGDVAFSIIDFIDTKLRFSESSANPDSTYLTVEKDERSDSMTILVGDIEAYEGDAHIDYAVIRINTPGAQTTSIIDDVDLILDGSSYSSEPVTTFSDNNSEAGPDGEFVWYVFQVDQSILDGEEISAEVQVQFEAQENNYSNFQPVQAEIDNETRDLWVVGGTYALTGGDNFVGNISGDTHYLLAEGLFIDESSIEIETNTLGENDTVGEFVFEFELTAFENDFYIPTSPSSAITYQIEGTESNPTVSVAITSTADEESQTYSIREGETENVQITFTIDPNSAGSYRVVLQDLFYSISSTGAPVVGSIADQQLVIRSPYQSINN